MGDVLTLLSRLFSSAVADRGQEEKSNKPDHRK